MVIGWPITKISILVVGLHKTTTIERKADKPEGQNLLVEHCPKCFDKTRLIHLLIINIFILVAGGLLLLPLVYVGVIIRIIAINGRWGNEEAVNEVNNCAGDQ